MHKLKPSATTNRRQHAGLIFTLFLGLIISLLGQLASGNHQHDSNPDCCAGKFHECMEIFCRRRTDRNVISAGGIIRHAMDHSHQLVFIVFNWITVVFFAGLGIIQSDGCTENRKRKRRPSSQLSTGPVFTWSEYECTESGTDSFLVYLDRIFSEHQGLLKSGFVVF